MVVNVGSLQLTVDRSLVLVLDFRAVSDSGPWFVVPKGIK
jgi:hypothetical protein